MYAHKTRLWKVIVSNISKDLGKPPASPETARVGKSGGVAVFHKRADN